MKFEKSYPPNIEQISVRFAEAKENKSVVFTYGDTLFAPHFDKEEVSDDVWVHESVHARQQGDSPDTWWGRYIEDKVFRFSQEVEAYNAQYIFIQNAYSRKIAKRALSFFASTLSSKLYGLNLSFGSVEKKIKKGMV